MGGYSICPAAFFSVGIFFALAAYAKRGPVRRVIPTVFLPCFATPRASVFWKGPASRDLAEQQGRKAALDRAKELKELDRIARKR